MIRLVVSFALLILSCSITAQGVPMIEGTIAGLTLGKSTLGDIQKKFGHKLIVDKKMGAYAVRIDGQCELFLGFGPEKPNPDQEYSRVMSIQLLNLGKGAERVSPCNEFATGRGLKLSDPPEKMNSLYGKPNNTFVEKLEIIENMAKYDNVALLCAQKNMLKFNDGSMFIEWSVQTNIIQSISLSLDPVDCAESDDAESP